MNTVLTTLNPMYAISYETSNYVWDPKNFNTSNEAIVETISIDSSLLICEIVD
jgi:hypothetical protein